MVLHPSPQRRILLRVVHRILIAIYLAFAVSKSVSLLYVIEVFTMIQIIALKEFIKLRIVDVLRIHLRNDSR